MPLMTWTDAMSVGVRQLDEDHKKLVAMVNQLHEGIIAGQGKEVLGGILDGLIAYTVDHFRREEQLFAKTGYPESADHQQQHNELTLQVQKVQASYKSGAASALSLVVMTFLKNWLTNHIMGTDKKYGPHLNAKGIR